MHLLMQETNEYFMLVKVLVIEFIITLKPHLTK